MLLTAPVPRPARDTLARRSVEKVREFLGVDPDVIVAGSHGYDVRGPGGLNVRPFTAHRPALDAARAALEAAVAHIPGCTVEDNTFSVSAVPGQRRRARAAPLDPTLSRGRRRRVRCPRPLF